MSDYPAIIGILRGFQSSLVPEIVRACGAGGLGYLEITMNSPGAVEQIRAAREVPNSKVRIGAGTVTSVRLLEQALEAGATFIVTPLLNREVVQECVRRGIPVFPGAWTPTEVVQAWEMGAAMVKVFPAESGGPAYLKALRAPFPHIKLLPTGGVDLEILPHLIKAGASGAGVGTPLFRRERIEARDWAWLELQTRRYLDTWRAASTGA